MSRLSQHEIAFWLRLARALGNGDARGGYARISWLTDRTLAAVYDWRVGRRWPKIECLDALIAAVDDLDDEGLRAGLLLDLQRWRAGALQRWHVKRLASRERFKQRFGRYPGKSKLPPGSEANDEPQPITPVMPGESGIPRSGEKPTF